MLMAKFLIMLPLALIISTTTTNTNIILSNTWLCSSLLLLMLTGERSIGVTAKEQNLYAVDKINLNSELLETNFYNYTNNSNNLVSQPQYTHNATLRKLHRAKRYLDFNKGTRMSWRSTVKNNILKANTLWGHGWGLRTNFPFADKADRLRPFFKRDVVHGLEDILNGHGLDGRACILKSFCTAILDVKSKMNSGMLFKLLKKVFELSTEDKRHFSYLREENCKQILHSHCILSFDSITSYTDDI